MTLPLLPPGEDRRERVEVTARLVRVPLCSGLDLVTMQWSCPRCALEFEAPPVRPETTLGTLAHAFTEHVTPVAKGQDVELPCKCGVVHVLHRQEVRQGEVLVCGNAGPNRALRRIAQSRETGGGPKIITRG